MKHSVLLTDYAWPDLDIERAILANAGARLVVAERSDAEHLAALAGNSDAIMTCWAKVPAVVIDAAPRCRIVSRLGIGLDNIDVRHCTAKGVPVTNVPEYCVAEVAEHALASIFVLARNIAFFHLQTKQGRYDLQAGPPMRRMVGQTLGIVGLGAIGRELARRATGVGLQVIAASRSRRDLPEGVLFCSFDELLARSDYLSLHVPLTDETQGMIGAAALARLKPSAFLINTARGGLIDHAALAVALQENRLAGAALDVQEIEPPDLDQPPYNDPRVIVTPHVAFLSENSLADLRRRATEQVVTALQGQRPRHVVNPQVYGS